MRTEIGLSLQLRLDMTSERINFEVEVDLELRTYNPVLLCLLQH